MKIDPGLCLLATLGAGLLTASGAVLRSAFARSRGGGPITLDDDLDDSDGEDGPRQKLDDALGQLASLRGDLSAAHASRESQRIEMVEQRQRAERQVQGAQAEIQRLSAELEAERGRTQAAEDSTKELRVKLTSTEDDLKRVRADAADPKALHAAKAELVDLQKSVKALSEERDAARAKVEALERLVEGVRARSRELADEVRKLRGQ